MPAIGRYRVGVSKQRSTPPGSQASLREANRARVVQALQQHGILTQVELAGVTGLSAATVHNIVKELSAAGTLQTRPGTRSGRRALVVSLARSLGLVAGVHVARRHLRVSIADLSHHIITERHLPLMQAHRADNELNRVALLINDMLSTLEAPQEELLAVGLGVAAPVDAESGMIGLPGALPGWEDVPLAQTLSRRLGKPVLVDADANLAALAESRLGAARGARHAAYVDVSYSISAGLVVDGSIYRGSRGFSGRLGQMILDEDGPRSAGGVRGSLDAYAGVRAMQELLRPRHGELRLRDIIQLAEHGDADCQRAIADAGRNVGVALAKLVSLLNPSRIIVGGELSAVGELLIGPIRHALELALQPGALGFPEVVRADLGERSAVMGAVLHALDSVPLADALAGGAPVLRLARRAGASIA